MPSSKSTRKCSSCGQARQSRHDSNASSDENEARRMRDQIDPTRALFAATSPRYEVATSSGSPRGSGKKFTTSAAAEDYARRTRGVVRPV